MERRKTCVDHYLHMFIASNFSIVQYMATNYRRGCAVPSNRTIRHTQVPIYAPLLHTHAAAYIRVQFRTNTRTTLRFLETVSTLRQYHIQWSGFLEFGVNWRSFVLRGMDITPVLREYVEKSVRNVRING